jgi:Transposase DDE domain
VDLTGPAPALHRGVARDRRVSVEDGEMRHGRKSRSVLFDGYKRHVLRDLDTGLIPAVGITPANAPEASVTDDITADLQAAGLTLAELHIDRAYLSSALVRDRGPGLAVFCKAWRVRNTGGRFAKDQFSLGFAAGQLTCPAGVSMPFQPGKTVRFPKATCAACPLRQRCTASSGRNVAIHPDEALLAELRQRQQTRKGARNCANASRSSTRLPTSGTGRAAAPATSAPARTCSTCDGPPSSTTSTSPPARPSPMVTR